ncbi:hypothetical protein [Microcystis aeruginosa]|uniref:Similar to tr/A2FNC4/A2FNC4_TRIVA Variable membrane protein n=1 Tax=Microcystis aeruginosa PCC 9808 TaxID=1160284 RepID=I4I0G1_MICAE|nr:hypothetical protein [Microcystis aeruginosa]CCI27785.1 Similar to tr/A2FNC4/A2FNC4_TRIVA Variable membrane protein [Microcystis aeruginosa PCC 9808]
MTTTSTPTLPTQAQWDAANGFLEELLTNNTLAQGYLNIAQQANGQDNAPAMLTDWLHGQGYDTTPALIYEALVAVQNIALGYWLGIYGQSYQQTGTISTDAPVLCILPDINGNITPYLNGVALVNYTFKSVESDGNFNPILSWGLESNSTAGEITFYYTPEVNGEPNPPTGYTGNWFQGTLQTGANAPQESFFGALGSASAEALPTVSLSEQETEQEQSESWWKKTIAWLNAHPAAWVGVGIGGLVVAVGLIYGGYKLARWAYQSIQQCLQERQEVQQEINNDFQDNPQEEIDPLEQGIRVRVENQQRQHQQQIIREEEEEESDAEIGSLEQEIRQEVQNEQGQLENQPQNNKLASPEEIKAMMDEAYPKIAEIWNNANKSRNPSAFANAETQITEILNQMSSAIEPDNGTDNYKSPLKKYIKTGNYDRLDQNNPEHRFIKALEDIKCTSRDQWLRSKQRQELIKNWEEIKPQRMEKLKEVKRQKEALKNQNNDQQGSEDQFADKTVQQLISPKKDPIPPDNFQPLVSNDNQSVSSGEQSQPTPPKITQQQTSQKVDVNKQGSSSQQSQQGPLSDQKIQQVEQKNQSSDQDSNDDDQFSDEGGE